MKQFTKKQLKSWLETLRTMGRFTSICGEPFQISFRQGEYEGRKSVFIHDTNEKEELKKNGNLIRSFEIEYPEINGDQLQIKINHLVVLSIDLQKGEDEWPKKLTPKEREITRTGIERCKLLEAGSEAKTYGSAIQNRWTYVSFLFDLKAKEFRIEKIETKSV